MVQARGETIHYHYRTLPDIYLLLFFFVGVDSLLLSVE